MAGSDALNNVVMEIGSRVGPGGNSYMVLMQEPSFSVLKESALVVVAIFAAYSIASQKK